MLKDSKKWDTYLLQRDNERLVKAVNILNYNISLENMNQDKLQARFQEEMGETKTLRLNQLFTRNI